VHRTVAIEFMNENAYKLDLFIILKQMHVVSFYHCITTSSEDGSEQRELQIAQIVKLSGASLQLLAEQLNDLGFYT